MNKYVYKYFTSESNDKPIFTVCIHENYLYLLKDGFWRQFGFNIAEKEINRQINQMKTLGFIRVDNPGWKDFLINAATEQDKLMGIDNCIEKMLA